ncbi:MAG: outer membrane protein assembly factor BamE [Candidatus Omnitrophota bacterium]
MIKTLQRCMTMAFFVTMAGIFLAGCATMTYGTKLDQSKVSQIKKGATTRAEVEALFGPPAYVSILNDGRRTMSYNFTETSMAVTPETFIPVVAYFAGGTRGQTKTQMLQIILSKADIVEDYEFTDSTSKTETKNSFSGTQTTSVPVVTVKK